MLERIAAIALNTYREAVRARLLLGVFALGMATCAYSLVIASLSLHNELRVVADLGAAALSLYGVLIAIVLGSTSLYRELEYKTVFPILSRPIRRWEYLLGKYAGIVLTVVVFEAVQAAAVFLFLALLGGQSPAKVGLSVAVWCGVAGAIVLRARHARAFAAIPVVLALPVGAYFLAGPAFEERDLVIAAGALSLCEVAVVTAVATLFASFSSPFLTALFTATVFVIGRSADTLAHLPKKMLGVAPSAFGAALARVVPNLHVYVPARALLLGEVAGEPVGRYVAMAAVQAASYAVALLVVGSWIFQKRDFS
jgi:Cu-processing system permease protein